MSYRALICKIASKMKRLIILYILALSCNFAFAQEQTLTFTSLSDAKFFVYINGKLQNERSSGTVKVKGLEEKDYHVRIVIDDPFEIAVTRTIKPDSKHNEYTVQFNAVRERVYLRPAANLSKGKEEDNNLWIPQDQTPRDTLSDVAPKPKHTSIRRTDISDTATRQRTNRIRTKTMEQ